MEQRKRNDQISRETIHILTLVPKCFSAPLMPTRHQRAILSKSYLVTKQVREVIPKKFPHVATAQPLGQFTQNLPGSTPTVARTYEVYLRATSSSQSVIFVLLHRYKCFKNNKKIDEKQRNDISDIFTSENMENMLFFSKRVVSYEIY